MDPKQNYWQQETLKYNWPHARMILIAEAIRQTSPGTRVLDLGAGKGLLARMIGPEYPYLGLDIVGGNDPSVWPRIDACDFDRIADYRPPEASYDVLVVSGLLEYLQDWRGFLGHVTSRWLVPRGLCLVSFTNPLGYRRAPVQKHPRWQNMPALPEIMHTLEGMGLTVERVYPLLWGNKSWGLPAVRALSAFARRRKDYLSLNCAWVSQFLCVARLVSRA